MRFFKRDKDSNSKMLFKIPEDHRHAMLEEAPEVTIHDARELQSKSGSSAEFFNEYGFVLLSSKT